MRQSILLSFILLSAAPAMAQSYQPAPTQQEANITNYPVPPTAYPQPPVYATPPQAPPAIPPSAYYDARPTDAGQSLSTDVRQMNF